MSEPVRLVIWDLDETFWIGTLAEDGIKQHVEANYAIVKALAARGIMSSICSKNDATVVRQLLIEKNIWNYFVFPSIDGSAKGPRVKYIVEATQLRPETVLFIDDNPSNLGEAQAFVPGLQVSDETILPSLLDNILLKGKDDAGLTRLAQYKLLEQKSEERKLYQSDVFSFLKSSSISVEIDYDIEPHLPRVVELINRTNQLNFTKNRLPVDEREAETELKRQIDMDYGSRAGVVKVRDKFGDYGVVGFFLVYGVWGQAYVVHFVFSCRTLGMGIEQWVYEKLGCPSLTISGEVISRLDFVPDWINLQPIAFDADHRGTSIPLVRLRGGCELEVLAHFFSFVSPCVQTEFVFPRDFQPVWKSHIQTLLPQPALTSSEGARDLAGVGLDAEDAETAFLSDAPPGSLLVLSNTADLEVKLFKHRNLGFRVPVHVFGLDVTHPATEDELKTFVVRERWTEQQAKRLAEVNHRLHSDFEVADVDGDDFRAMYKQAFDGVPAGALLVVLLPMTYAKRPGDIIVHYDRQSDLNALMRHEAAGRANVRVVNVADAVTSPDDLLSYSHLHLTRKASHKVFEIVAGVYRDWTVVS